METTTTTKDTAYLTFNEETQPDDINDNHGTSDRKPTNQFISKLVGFAFNNNSKNKTNTFNLSLSNTECT